MTVSTAVRVTPFRLAVIVTVAVVDRVGVVMVNERAEELARTTVEAGVVAAVLLSLKLTVRLDAVVDASRTVPVELDPP